MARTFIAFDPRSGKREVIVEVKPELGNDVSSDELDQLKRRLYDRHVNAGLLVTPDKAYFVRDTLASLEFSTTSYEVQELATATLLSRLRAGPVAEGEGLYAQVKLWLSAVAGSWSTFVPDEALPMMMPEMIGGLAESHVEEWYDVLDAGD
jgi:hypothetical protein